MLQVAEGGLSFDEFEFVDLPFYRPRPKGQCQSGADGRFVPCDAAGKGHERSQARCLHLDEPIIQRLWGMLPHHHQPTLHHLTRQMNRRIGFAQRRSALLVVGRERLGASNDPPHNPTGGDINGEATEGDCAPRCDVDTVVATRPGDDTRYAWSRGSPVLATLPTTPFHCVHWLPIARGGRSAPIPGLGNNDEVCGVSRRDHVLEKARDVRCVARCLIAAQCPPASPPAWSRASTC